ncbi:CopG family ribbon-helix-helix protein [Rhizobium panacihumi]|uniref:CopG family ribbon-helix-helix protein n=1 Tax=Rhizobium panacihumi TaxID=2008450 RepID=UPI003D79DCB9
MGDRLKDQSLRLKPGIRARLDAEAVASDQTEAEIVDAAIEIYLASQTEKRAQLEQAIAVADEGVFISSQKMADWISSWGTENERPAPEPDIALKPRQGRKS